MTGSERARNDNKRNVGAYPRPLAILTPLPPVILSTSASLTVNSATEESPGPFASLFPFTEPALSEIRSSS